MLTKFMFIYLFSFLIQNVKANPALFPSLENWSLQTRYTPIYEQRSYLPDFEFSRFNPFEWFSKSDSKDDKLDALFEILECLTQSGNFSGCKETIGNVKPTFSKKKKTKDIITTVAPPMSTVKFDKVVTEHVTPVPEKVDAKKK